VSIGGGKQTILKAGDFFGEMALLERRRHKHDVVAKSRCRVLVLDTQALSRLTRRHPEVLVYIRQVAKTRKETAEPAEGRNRRRKPHKLAVPSNHDEPETI
jgi:voltage-gated potassium channel